MKEPSVLFYDNHLLVLSKPAGLLTQPSDQETDSLEEWGKKWVKQQFRKPGNVFLQAVHRLDRPASGIVLFARTSKALSRLQAASREGKFKKTYLCLIEGNLKEKEGTFEDWLIHDSHRAIDGSPHEKDAKKASLHYLFLEEQKPYSLVQVVLKTGRYHQIRMQFSKRGFPIVGDQKYGSHHSLSNPNAIALHHAFLEIPHPIEKQPISWTSSPDDVWPLLPSIVSLNS